MYKTNPSSSPSWLCMRCGTSFDASVTCCPRCSSNCIIDEIEICFREEPLDTEDPNELRRLVESQARDLACAAVLAVEMLQILGAEVKSDKPLPLLAAVKERLSSLVNAR